MSTLRVVAAVLHDGGRYLACRRAPHKDQAGRWEFPGGKVEAGESPVDALAREIREELGVRIHVGRLIDRSVTGRVDLACYAASLDDAAPTASTDHDALRWVTVEELPELAWAEADRAVVRVLVETGGSGGAGRVVEGEA